MNASLKVLEKHFGPLPETLTVYAIRNAEGQWLRAMGFGGNGASWVDNIFKAKLYTKLSQARSRVTFWANAYPDEKPPVILAFSMSTADAQVLDEVDRIAKVKLKKSTEEAERARREAKRRMKAAEETIKQAEAEIRRLQQGVVK